ncbi:DNA-processing protein DprA [Solwaraspora sp. WMMA2065]|uniref:DNA-processing protein DprA n=1 Tax=Solwaraspora sp. WMMA2065 TaxID=3015166 RepID=UPI00259B07B3|nr:DNA-processing protein DprA [Solwaraspora sp. WMMA2065]WJK33493.1 DNA-processing protein DprA [Solwaraspora sp. WMMA2065]
MPDRTLCQPETLFPAVTGSGAELVAATADEIAGWQADGIGVHAFSDDSYPAQLRGIKEAPPLLFTRGRLRANDRAIAVIGSRKASERGLVIARSVAASLVNRGVTVASGLAHGIDTAAHTAALAAGGRTVAVIGTGIRNYYPSANRRLQDHIAEVGLVVSQFRPDAGPTRQSFPMRNAVMSGYAVATLIVEAGETSGARIQARLALGHGWPVILTSHALQSQWAQALANRPGVHVVRCTAELIEAVDGILNRLPLK